MKLCLYADNHFSQYSSILRSRCGDYSTRLVNQIASLNWVEQIAVENECKEIICLGDFFNTSSLNAEEIRALQDVKWQNIPHVFLVGNHEMGNHSSTCSSAHLFKMLPTASVFDTPCYFMYRDTEVCFLPYITEDDRQPLSEYFDSWCEKRVILSHNDIKGIQMGKCVSDAGFSISEIHNNCNLFLNGHLHNRTIVDDVIENIGNLTGQNFSEDAAKYPHGCVILDLDTLTTMFIENPYALNFYKLEGSAYSINQVVSRIKHNSVVSVTTAKEDIQQVKEILSKQENILEYRVLSTIEKNTTTTSDVHLEAVDHIKQFREYITSQYNKDSLVMSELDEVCR